MQYPLLELGMKLSELSVGGWWSNCWFLVRAFARANLSDKYIAASKMNYNMILAVIALVALNAEAYNMVRLATTRAEEIWDHNPALAE